MGDLETGVHLFEINSRGYGATASRGRLPPSPADAAQREGQGRMRPEEGHVVVGWIRGAWGVQGDLKVEVHTDLPTRFAPGSVLHLDGQATRVERSRTLKNGVLIKLDAVADRTAAEALRGRVLTVPQSEVEPLPDGAYYQFQIIDMAVWSEEGEYLGKVAEILPSGGTDVYVVRDDGRRDMLLPALADVIVDVDVDACRMTVRPPEGLA